VSALASAPEPPTTGVLATVGATPLVELTRIEARSPFRVYAKLEAANPGGSVKDRSALAMLLARVRDGTLVPGRSVVIESSSGNLGIGLAQACRYFGIRFVCVVDPRANAQNVAIMRAYGAEVEVVRQTDPVTREYLPVRIRRVRELVAATPHAYCPDQYANLLNARAHETTMREIVDALPGPLDFLFCPTSSCGMLRGCAEFARRHGLAVRIVAVDAAGSAIFGDTPRQRLVPGHGASIRPPLFREGLADEVVHVDDLGCLVGCRRLVAEEAVLAGGSSGAAVAAVAAVRERIPAGANCVLVLPDRGERYLDTIYDDAWVSTNFGDVSHLWTAGEMESAPC
jgi:N-(2-amino-2-carboxyethyl)-L-glutamate synthase